MEFTFYKYQGTGNDFVIIDNREEFFPKENTELVAKICDRRFGVGADGLLLLENHPSVDFMMVYYNSDGNLSSMCGNGGRCIAHFAKFLGIISEKTTFEAVDGMHEAMVSDDWVSLKMNNVEKVKVSENFTFLNTGSPHHVEMVSGLENYDVFTNGRNIRNEIYGKEGSNVNFVEQNDAANFSVRTYERGVEDETLSCGTGVTAVAIAMFENGKTSEDKVILKTPGGQLQVRFEKAGSGYKNVYLEGPATQVFKGIWK
ncbi:MAG TPA: diaminopimelate epimerase [Aequorivita sp.]|jgi:diaminopimelate epimerase|nr:diaminopimelate epimerase [Aequorivita sp.]MBP41811.1 diaminopimelate epimerase [Aequorivita sp.]HNP69192.1 diaminopimelate epimerase [Aequorivita sp.]|tara:strand:- start:25244 stop:26017 length:774 start_codon:yes stop_codon:yes gene_type:complete